MANSSANVVAGKPKVGGAVYRAPIGTALPTDSTTALNEAFVCLGYISEDGVTNNNTTETENIRAWGGDVVLTSVTEKTDEWTMTLIESLNVGVLKAVYGSSNVAGTLATGITIESNADSIEAGEWVIDMVLKGGGTHRVVLPNASVSKLGEITYADDSAVGFEVTLTCAADAEGNTHYEYYKQA